MFPEKLLITPLNEIQSFFSIVVIEFKKKKKSLSFHNVLICGPTKIENNIHFHPMLLQIVISDIRYYYCYFFADEFRRWSIQRCRHKQQIPSYSAPAVQQLPPSHGAPASPFATRNPDDAVPVERRCRRGGQRQRDVYLHGHGAYAAVPVFRRVALQHRGLRCHSRGARDAAPQSDRAAAPSSAAPSVGGHHAVDGRQQRRVERDERRSGRREQQGKTAAGHDAAGGVLGRAAEGTGAPVSGAEVHQQTGQETAGRQVVAEGLAGNSERGILRHYDRADDAFQRVCSHTSRYAARPICRGFSV